MTNLYLVATPIGNLDDFSIRGVETLKQVDLIYCEDTRVSSMLLKHYSITTPLKSYHIFNENKIVDTIISELKKGLVIALITDAGYPSISDPGYLVVRSAILNNFVVSCIPGPTAILPALSCSGIKSDKFLFYGFLHHTKSQKEKELLSLVDIPYTIILYESPKRVLETIKLISLHFKNRNICIARELTKKFEEFIRFNTSNSLDLEEIKGEIVIVIEGAYKKSVVLKLNEDSIINHYNYYLEKGYSKMDAMKEVSKDRNISKSIIYKNLLEKEKK